MKVSIVQVAQLAEWLQKFSTAESDAAIVRGLADLAKIADDIVCAGPFGRFRKRPSAMTPAEFVGFLGRTFPVIMSGASAAELVSAVKAFRVQSGAQD